MNIFDFLDVGILRSKSCEFEASSARGARWGIIDYRLSVKVNLRDRHLSIGPHSSLKFGCTRIEVATSGYQSRAGIGHVNETTKLQ